MLLYILIALVAVGILGICVFLSSRRFGRLPRGDRRKRIEQSPNFRKGKFRNQLPTTAFVGSPSKIMLNFLFVKKNVNRRPNHPLETVETDLRSLASAGKDSLVWLGHSSYMMVLGGRTVLVDPVLDSGAPFKWMNPMFPLTPGRYVADDIPVVDLLVITHDHWDHLDYNTLRKLHDRIIKIVCPLGVGEHLEYWNFSKEQIYELDWDETATPYDNLTITATPARHFSGRLFHRNQTLWASFVVQTPSLTLFCGCDGGYGPHFKDIAEKYPKIDLAIIENGQYNPAWPLIHTLPAQLPQVVADLHPKRALTIHHNLFALAEHPWDEPLRNALWLRENQSETDILIPPIGGIVEL